jgi:hypothetical protein
LWLFNLLNHGFRVEQAPLTFVSEPTADIPSRVGLGLELQQGFATHPPTLKKNTSRAVQLVQLWFFLAKNRANYSTRAKMGLDERFHLPPTPDPHHISTCVCGVVLSLVHELFASRHSSMLFFESGVCWLCCKSVQIS